MSSKTMRRLLVVACVCLAALLLAYATLAPALSSKSVWDSASGEPFPADSPSVAGAFGLVLFPRDGFGVDRAVWATLEEYRGGRVNVLVADGEDLQLPIADFTLKPPGENAGVLVDAMNAVLATESETRRINFRVLRPGDDEPRCEVEVVDSRGRSVTFRYRVSSDTEYEPLSLSRFP